jgi:hypothetical protein
LFVNVSECFRQTIVAENVRNIFISHYLDYDSMRTVCYSFITYIMLQSFVILIL